MDGDVVTVSLIKTCFLSIVCDGGSKVLTDSNGRLNSPDSGQSGTCTWKLDVPKDLRIIFYFESYEIDYCGYATCSGCSRVELKDGPNEPPWKLFCGRKSEIPEPISTNKSVLFVNFVLANGDLKSWFTAEYVTWPFEGSMNEILSLLYVMHQNMKAANPCRCERFTFQLRFRTLCCLE